MTHSPQARAWLDCELARVWALAAPDRGPAEGAETLEALRRAAPIGRLAAALGLSELELEILVIALAPQVDPDLAAVFAGRHNDYGRRGVDLALVAELLGLDRAGRIELVEAVDPNRPLVAHRLLEVSGPDPRSALFRGVAPGLDVMPMLLSADELSPALHGCATLVRAPDTLDDLVFDDGARAAAAELVRTGAGLANRATPAWTVLWGPRGAGKRTLAGRIAARAGRPLLVLDTRVVDSGRGDELLRRAVRDALYHGAVLYIGSLGGTLLDDGAHELLRRLHRYHGPLILGVDGTAPPQIRDARVVEEVEVGPPGPKAQLALWQRAIPDGARAAELDLPLIARCFRLTPGEIADIGAGMVAVDGAHGVDTVSLKAAIDRRLRNQLADLARRVEVSHDWSQLVLAPAQIERARALIARHRNAETVYDEWGLGQRVGYGKGIISLFSGPPGTGKTMLAGLIAAELGLDLYKVDLSQVVSKWVGETEKQLARIFDLAARAHAVLLFDEADALLARRTKVDGANDRYGNLAVSYLLARFEDYDGVVILTSNLESSLDPAIARRLTLHLRLDTPDEDERLALWRSFLPDELPREDDLALERLADDFDLSGGHIKNAAIRAAFLAAAESCAVNREHLRRAVQLEMDNLGRLS